MPCLQNTLLYFFVVHIFASLKTLVVFLFGGQLHLYIAKAGFGFLVCGFSGFAPLYGRAATQPIEEADDFATEGNQKIQYQEEYEDTFQQGQLCLGTALQN